MTRRLSLRAGLVAFIVAALLGVFLSLPTFHPSYAQVPAATPAEPTAAAPEIEVEGLDITLHGEIVQ